MTLFETVQALEAKNITIALDLGVHQSCALDSNCPLAVQLRKLIADAGITLEELLEGYQEVTAPDPVDMDRVLPAVSAILHMHLLGQEMHINLGEDATHEFGVAVKRKIEELEHGIYTLRGIGRTLYSSYLAEIRRSRDNGSLPQLSFTVTELLTANCLITSRDRKYVFIFPAEYRPRYIVHRHTRHQLSDEDAKSLERNIYIKFTINQNHNFFRADTITSDGRKFRHYHGNGQYDCWGEVTLPNRWDGHLSSLTRLNHTLIMSLGTINRGSVLDNDPPHMPDVEDLMENSTELGREGEVSEHPVEQPTRGRGWGGRARNTPTQIARDRVEALARGTGNQPAPEGEPPPPFEIPRGLTPEEERMRRFNITNPPRDMRIICNLCGEQAGEHFGHGTECRRDHRPRRTQGRQPVVSPLDEEMMRRYGRAVVDGDHDTICALCGERLGNHYGTRAEVCPRDHR